MTNDEYRAHPAISKSDLDQIAISPQTLEWSRAVPSGSEAANFGTIFHLATLQHDEFARRVVTAPKIDRRTNAGKAEYAAFEAESAGKLVLSFDDREMLGNMLFSLVKHPEARELIEACRVVETPVFGTDIGTGLAIKCMPDVRSANRPLVVDLKTTDNMERIIQSIVAYRYHVQDAHYSAILAEEAYNGEWPEFAFVVVGKTRSLGRHPVRVIYLDELAKEAGERLRRRDLETWAAYQAGERFRDVVSLPNWALPAEMTGDTELKW